MTFKMNYGDGDTVCVDLPPDAVCDCSRPHGNPVDDPAAAVAVALKEPLDFPPLRRAIVPGDRVAIAIDRGVPQLPAVIAGIASALLEGSVQPEDICVVLADPDDLTREPLSALAPSVRDAIELVVHDPAQMNGLTYLAASRDGKPIYFNRRIGDADVVVPVGVLRLDGSWGYVGVHGCLFPTFSDATTQERFRSVRSDWRSQQRHRRKEADEAAWLLGVQFTLQITPGAGDSILNVLAGDAPSVAERGRQLCESAWLHRGARRASLVVATIEGGQRTQTWDNLTRALLAASQAVTEGGSIVLCTNLRQPPGKFMKKLAGNTDGDELMRKLDNSMSEDAFTARLFACALEHARVFLLSELDEETVEDLGLGHVSHVDEILRLSRKHDSCILVGNAHQAQVATDE